MSTAARLEPGQTAPDFTATDQDGSSVSLSGLRGRRVLLYFYPQAATPGCTTQACDFRDDLRSFASAGITVLGMSPDAPAKNKAFAEKEGLTFPLLSDEDHSVAESYGAWGEKKNYGKTYEGLIRSTFVIDAEGRIEKALYNVKATGHVARLRRDLGIGS